MAERRTVRAHVRLSPAELAAWRAKAAAVGVPLSELLRQAMARTRTWTAADAAVERERTRQVVRVGNNLNQLARWANTHASEAGAVEVAARLVSVERSLLALARFAGDDTDAH
ncbi:MAG: MobC family plasmid mobilization relaxosome protein [Acidobacteria bacterium]|nr:MobC family plasmid mobilization relaxosome protein [Acidobacteriota bacterium]MYI40353.1 MobC family plasmid mobilization relaxosome protein [Acidobacteriota bacterium]